MSGSQRLAACEDFIRAVRGLCVDPIGKHQRRPDAGAVRSDAVVLFTDECGAKFNILRESRRQESRTPVAKDFLPSKWSIHKRRGGPIRTSRPPKGPKLFVSR
jgi:hypothetical protein